MITAKKLVNLAFGTLGLELSRKPTAQPIPRASMAGLLNQLFDLGLRPRTVIDVGVATQTEELYQPFKESTILLIEPLVEYEPFLRNICAVYNAQYVLAAAGANRGTAVLNVHPDKFGSSLLKEVEGAAVDGTPREVPVVTIDEVCFERKLGGPFVIKIDVQGAELLVLAGAARTLDQTEVIILEVTLFGTLIGGPQLFEIVSSMKALGFVVYDIFGLHYRPFDNALSQVDMVFVRENGMFRKHHVYATPEQRKEIERRLAEGARAKV